MQFMHFVFFGHIFRCLLSALVNEVFQQPKTCESTNLFAFDSVYLPPHVVFNNGCMLRRTKTNCVYIV